MKTAEQERSKSIFMYIELILKYQYMILIHRFFDAIMCSSIYSIQSLTCSQLSGVAHIIF